MRSGAVASLLGMRKTRVVSFCSMFAMGTPYWKIGIHPKYRQLSFHSSASGTRQWEYADYSSADSSSSSISGLRKSSSSSSGCAMAERMAAIPLVV